MADLEGNKGSCQWFLWLGCRNTFPKGGFSLTWQLFLEWLSRVRTHSPRRRCDKNIQWGLWVGKRILNSSPFEVQSSWNFSDGLGSTVHCQERTTEVYFRKGLTPWTPECVRGEPGLMTWANGTGCFWAMCIWAQKPLKTKTIWPKLSGKNLETLMWGTTLASARFGPRSRTSIH